MSDASTTPEWRYVPVRRRCAVRANSISACGTTLGSFSCDRRLQGQSAALPVGVTLVYLAAAVTADRYARRKQPMPLGYLTSIHNFLLLVASLIMHVQIVRGVVEDMLQHGFVSTCCRPTGGTLGKVRCGAPCRLHGLHVVLHRFGTGATSSTSQSPSPARARSRGPDPRHAAGTRAGTGSCSTLSFSTCAASRSPSYTSSTTQLWCRSSTCFWKSTPPTSGLARQSSLPANDL
jgi:hypothetical protein